MCALLRNEIIELEIAGQRSEAQLLHPERGLTNTRDLIRDLSFTGSVATLRDADYRQLAI